MEIRPRRSKFLDYNIEDALIGHHCNLSVKSELFQNVLYILRESVQVITEVSLNVIGIIQKSLKCIFAGVIKCFSRHIPEQDILHRKVFYMLVFLKNSILCIS